jgi:hypothetical protein
MITFFRLLGLACIVVASLTIQLASRDTLAALGVCCLIGFCVMGFGLCVMAGQVTDQDLDEANGLHHPDDLEGKN